VPAPQTIKEQNTDYGDIDLSKKDFARIVARVHATTGIVLKEHKEVMVRSRISRRLRDLGYSDFSSYLDYLEGPEGNTETINFCNAITTNLTSFFREGHHFEHLKNELENSSNIDKNRLRIWSAGCSTGEEPYSIAMTMLSVQRASMIEDKKILATDLDTNVLKKGQAACYEISKLKSIPAHFQNEFIHNKGPDEFKIAPRASRLISFNRLNLLGNWPFKGPFDFIFCRNVLIYFDAETKAALIDKYANMLKVGGVLYLGHSETILEEHSILKGEGKTTYRRSA